jgi:CubicO group peptidase (beta-lactamase class C family)
VSTFPVPHRSAAVFIAGLLLLTIAGCGTGDIHPGRSPGIDRFPSARDLYALAETYRVKHRLPALGVGIVHQGQIVALGMAGERAIGTGEWAGLDDAFDVASCTKSVTATIAAMLVQDGVVRWDTTVAEALPELVGTLHPGYATTTLELLLRHRGGVDHELNRNDRWAAWHREHIHDTPTGQRRQFAQTALQRPPRYPPGTDTYYTSDGYIIAGSMLERAAGIDWEQLVRTRLFAPLDLRSMEYGAIPGDGSITQVFGHEAGWFGRPRTFAFDPDEYGRHPFGAPAGFLYASVPDLLRYLDFHIQGAQGRDRRLPRAVFQRLHFAPVGEPFALGWASETQRDARGTITEHSVFHGGYSGRARANLWFSPETGWGTVIVTNHGGGDDAITADIFYALLREFGLVTAQP